MEPVYNYYDSAINGDHVYCQRAQHLGVFKGYLFCDYRGGIVAFKPGAKSSPIPPISEIPLIRPFPAIPPILAIPSISPIPAAISSLDWAAMGWQQFIRT